MQKQGGVAIVTADHGNCEQMIDPATGGPHTAHTTYSTSDRRVDDRFKGKKLRDGGRLADVAPTALADDGPAGAGGDDGHTAVCGVNSPGETPRTRFSDETRRLSAVLSPL